MARNTAMHDSNDSGGGTGNGRTLQSFPSRNYPYHRLGATLGDAAADESAAEDTGDSFRSLPNAGDTEDFPPPSPNTLHRFLLGKDAAPRPMTDDERAALHDPMGRLLRRDAPFPLSLRALLTAFDNWNGTTDALPRQLVFLAAEGGHIPWSPETNNLRREFRYVVARGDREFNLLISSSTNADSLGDAAFLQVIGWDDARFVYHYYERRGGTWFWAGKSPHALHSPTRSRGPFDSHVNGSLVMKELRAPWIHWHSPTAGITDSALAPNDPMRDDPLFRGRATADALETLVVRPGIQRWNRTRVRQTHQYNVETGEWRDVPTFLRQIFSTTSVNLATSDRVSARIIDIDDVRLPTTFFLNTDTLLDTLGLEPDALEIVTITGGRYREYSARYDTHRSDGNIRVDGDVHFAFLTPEPAFEDTDLADAMVKRDLLTQRFLAAVAMTDFCNPVFSARRARLLKYVPETLSAPGGTAAAANAGEILAETVVANVRAAVANDLTGATQRNSAEREFLRNYDTPDWKSAFVVRIGVYCQNIWATAQTDAGVDGWFRLADSRRRMFRKRPLAEFPLTLPRTNIPDDAPRLELLSSGAVRVADMELPTEL